MPAFSLCISRIGLTPHRHTRSIPEKGPKAMVREQCKNHSNTRARTTFPHFSTIFLSSSMTAFSQNFIEYQRMSGVAKSASHFL